MGFGEGFSVTKSLLHGLVQGAAGAVQSHDFKSGFIGGFISSIGGGVMGDAGLDSWGGRVLRVVAMGAVGGTAAQLSGGSFANGAVSAAFVQMFNDANIRFKDGTNTIARNGREFVNIILNAVNGSIDSIDIYGHANITFQSFDTQDASLSTLVVKGGAVFITDENFNIIANAGVLLSGKFNPSGTLYFGLDGCNTGDNNVDYSVAQTLSKNLLGVMVFGNQNKVGDPSSGFFNYLSRKSYNIFNTFNGYKQGVPVK